MFAVTAAAIPTNKVSNQLRPVTSYLDPYFTQNWRLFAPNPIAEDRTLWFRGEYLDAAGQTQTTKWLNWSEVELDLVHHKIVGGRAGYITNKMIGPLNTRFFALNLKQRKAAAQDKDTAMRGYVALRAELASLGTNGGAVDAYLRYETSAVRLATDVVSAAYPRVTLTAVRYRIMSRKVTPYANRGESAAERAAVRPAAVIRRSGWRQPIHGPKSEQRVIASFLARHR